MKTKLIGVTRLNPDGTNRQKLLSKAKEGDALYFEVETTLEEFSPVIDKITGGDGNKNYGCNIDIPELDEYGDYYPFDDDDEDDDDDNDLEEDAPTTPMTKNQWLTILGVILFVLYLLSRMIRFKN